MTVVTTMTTPLAQELEYYEKMKPEWLQTHSGRVALIKGADLVGWFDKELEAFEEGVRQFKTESFLVKRVLEHEPTYEAPAYTLGLLRAAS